MDITARQMMALEMRRDGKKLREIGAALGISVRRVQQLLERAELIERQSTWAEGLPSRYVAALLGLGIQTRDSLAGAIADGSLARMPGIGPKCYEVITQWLRGP